ncbi:MAG: hypothetical protein ACTMHL_11285 [Janibacter sp.]
MELLSDVSAGDWLLDRIGDWARVGGVAGTGFEAYARILHPVPARRDDLTVADEYGMNPTLEETHWPWSRVANRQGLAMHPLVQWNRLADLHQGVDFDDGWRVGQTDEGVVDLDLLAALTEHLDVATDSSDEVVAGFWEGWGELCRHGGAPYIASGSRLLGWWSRRRARRTAMAERRGALLPEVERAAREGPFLEWSERDFVLFATSLAELARTTWPERSGLGILPGRAPLSPQMIWPGDHAWVVASEIDWDSTIVAGSRALVDAVLADDRFEAFEVGEDADLTYEGDLINPPRAGWPEAP